ncbi:hypothetical protein [Serinicoccus kebangsaanensis]|uniref:hypothetical protein n=1 Tax=Serinicoccus kebangsaanensis TaxID=2602069 RepID=UPI001EE36015|nr:hypothetical protein [Serinicoccus kebangsaanensis]
MSTATLAFPDGEGLADLATYVRRAARLDPDGAVRLQVAGSRPVLAAWVCVLPGVGLLRSGLVLGLRTTALAAGSAVLDTTVPLAGLTDRFARRGASRDASTELPVPPTTLAPAWAALSPPRGGWEPVGRLPVELLVRAAREGIAEVAEGTPEGAGSAAVETLRARVWGQPVDDSSDVHVPRGAGLALHALGFVGDRPGGAGDGAPGEGIPETATVHRQGAWLRVSTAAGHALLRP